MDAGVARQSAEPRPKKAASGFSPDQAHLRLASALEQARSRLLSQNPRNRLLSYHETARDVAILTDEPDRVYEHLVVAGASYFFQPLSEGESEAGAPTALQGRENQQPGSALPTSAPGTPDGDIAVAKRATTTEGSVEATHVESGDGSGQPSVSAPAPSPADPLNSSEVSYILGPDGTLTQVTAATAPSPAPPSTSATQPGDTDSVAPRELLAGTKSPASPDVEVTVTPGVAPAQPGSVSPLETEQPAGDGDSGTKPAGSTPSEQAADGSVLFEMPQRSGPPERAPVADDHLPTPFSEEQLERRLHRLHQEQRSVVEEMGVNRLHLAFGFLRWHDSSESQSPRLAPLILLPVQLEKVGRGGSGGYQLAFNGEAADTNHALSERLSHGLAITLPSFSEEQSPETYWKEVEASVIDHIEEGWKVVPEVALGMFPADGQSLWLDLEPSHWPTENPLLDRPIVQRVLLGPRDSDQPPEELTRTYDADRAGAADSHWPVLNLICDADPFQRAALLDAFEQKEGLVIEGPPGTGKSQTITNLIAAALDQGMSVLFVAEKAIALETVKQRLSAAGLTDFCLDLHGLNTGSQALLQSIRERMNHRAVPPSGFEQRRQDLQQAREELVAVSMALSEPSGPESLPLHDVVWRAEGLRRTLPDDFSPVPVPRAEALDLPTLKKFSGYFEELGKVWSALPRQAAKAWYGFVPSRYEDSKRAGIEGSLQEMLKVIDETADWLAGPEVSPLAAELRDTRRLVQLGGMDPVSGLPTLQPGTTAALAHKLIHSGLFSELQELLEKLSEYKNAVSVVDRVFDSQAQEAEAHAQTLHKHAELLIGKLCGEKVLLADLGKEVEQLNGLIEVLESLPKLSEPVLKLLSRSASTLDDYANIAEEAEKLSAGPGELWLHANPSHAAPIAAERLNSALEERGNLKRFAEAALGIFALEKTLDPQALKWAYHTVQQGKSRFGPKGAEYKRAEELIRSTLKKGGYFSNKPKFMKSLESFIQYCDWCQEFEQSEFYKESFGFLFKGMDSNWNAMERLVNFSQQLRQQVGEAEAKKILSDWEGHTRAIGRARSGLTEAIARTRQYRKDRDLADTLWQQPVTEIVAALRKWATGANSSIEAIRQPWCNGRVTLADAREALNGYRRAKALEQGLRSHPAFKSLLGPHWKGAATQVDAVQAAKVWVDTCLKLEGVDLKLLRWLITGEQGLAKERWDVLMRKAGRFRTALNQQYAQLKQSGEVKLRYWLGVEDSSLDGFRRKLNACVETLDALMAMARWRFLHQEASQQGYEPLVQAITSGRLAVGHAGRAFEYCAYMTLLEHKIDRNPLLASFSPTNFEKSRDRFAELDRQSLADSGLSIASKLSRVPVPEGVGHGSVNTFSEKSLLNHELAKTSHLTSVRQLLSRASNAVKALKPCFIMSPSAVAQCLPPRELHFDLVILDEASQLRTENVLGAVARGRKVIVFGDSKQFLPGRSPADTVSDAHGQDTKSTDAPVSILGACLQHFPRRRLRRHYRSRHETLIQFSNVQFYSRDMVVPPSPRRADGDEGVHVTSVDNTSYRNGRNEKEAAAVVNAALAHYRQRPEDSLGVVAFGERQAEEIRRILGRRCSEEPALEKLLAAGKSPEPLFIKSLDNIQGDERDVILVSTTYVPEEVGGALSLDFGPGTGDLGWRRVNVVATRARRRLELFTSLKASDLPDQTDAGRGIRMLRGYLELALVDRAREPVTDAVQVSMSYLEATLAEVIEELGYRVVPRAGNEGFTVDLAVVDPDRPDEYLLGIECDGADYHGATDIRERDRIRRELLEAKGWILHRIWSVRWYCAREREIVRLKQAIEESLERTRAHADRQTGAQAAAPETGASPPTRDEEQEKRLLKEALDRFWNKNIKPQLPVRENSILSPEITEHLVAATPATPSEWEAAVPSGLRQGMDSRQTVFLPAVLSVIAEYA